MNYFTLILSFSFLFKGYSVYYATLSKPLKREVIYELLSRFNINLLDYERLDREKIRNDPVILNLPRYSKIILEQFFVKSHFYTRFEAAFCMDDTVKKKNRIAMDNHFAIDLHRFGLLLQFADYFSEQGRQVYLFATNDLYTQTILENQKRSYKNLCPAWFQSFFNVFKFGIILATKIVFNLKRKWRYSSGKQQQRPATSPEKPQEQRASQNSQILFFPHHGIYYGRAKELYTKDFFYNSDPQSPFFHSKILHLSLGEGDDILQDSWDFYESESIPYADFHQFPAESFLNSFWAFFKLLFSNKSLIFKEFNSFRFSFLSLYFVWFRTLRYHLSILNHFKEARFTLIGYDILFPPFLSVALALKGIKTIAVQDRFLAPLWVWHKIIVDYYFVASPLIQEKIESGADWCCVEKAIPLGLIKTDFIFQESQHPFDPKYTPIKEKYLLVLALDYSVCETKMDNCSTHDINWKNVKKFYKDMIRLAVALPGIYLVIKGRDLVNNTHPEFVDLIDLIETLPNITIETDLETYTPAKMAALVDAALALYTSIGDEMLAAGKPVIFYDFFGFPTPFFAYEGYPVIVNNYTELEERMTRILTEGNVMDAQQFEQMRNRLYGGRFDGNIKKLLDEELRLIYNFKFTKK